MASANAVSAMCQPVLRLAIYSFPDNCNATFLTIYCSWCKDTKKGTLSQVFCRESVLKGEKMR